MTLDNDVEALLRKQMRERGISFKQALNQAVRRGLWEASQSGSFSTPTAKLGLPTVSLDRALQLAA